MGFVDTHVHLHFPEYREDLNVVLERAQKAGLELFMNVGTDVKSSEESLALAEKYPFVWAAAGIHPHDAKNADRESLSRIAEILSHSKMAAIGEVGLDFFREHSPREKQIEVLKVFLDLHRKTQKPLIIHCRDAYEELLKILREKGGPFQGVMHCFSSDSNVMAQFLDLGFSISFAGPLTYKKNDALRDACKACPLDRLLLETDGPFLPPQSKRGQRNEPAFLLETAETASKLHGISLQELGARTSTNALRLFRL